ncbi:AMP-binding protein, partial [Francisella sp. SYW-9]|uniref:AMP-binding protein n=1 Tax=Francisella sp. SYW-9 TaxID=2610888 RepID=UPI00123D27B5
MSDIKTIAIDEQNSQTIYQSEESNNLLQYSKAKDLGYVIYTSGTTGLPKGVMVEHKSLACFLSASKTYLDLNKYNILSLTKYVFDIFVLEYGLPLITGSSVYLSQIDKVNEKHLESINIVQQTPGVLSLLVNNKDLYKDIFCLVGGERLSNNIRNLLQESFKKVINCYGPTESTIWSSFGIVDNNAINIGKPLNNEKMYVLDQHHQPVSIGVIGELYIGGAGLARGYLNRPELTEERFVSNPFATNSDIAKGYTRLYKTGDLVRWLEDGNIEYIGRNDDQVKIRGYRIELGEIENQLSAIAGIKQSCVLAKDRNNSKYLVGYYVSDVESLTQEEILNQLSKVLPEYMVPSVLVEIESMPLTVNGKLDRKALPNPEFINEDRYIAPTTELEERLCTIFGEVLGLERIGITDDFFRVGGNSILAIRLVSNINVKLGSNISVRDVFDYKSIVQLSRLVNTSIGQFKYKDYLITEGHINDYKAFELTNVQQAYLYGRLDSFEMGNVSTHVYSELLFNEFSIKRFEQAFNKLIQRHGVLRTIFTDDSQLVLSEVPEYKIVNHGEIIETELISIRDRLSHKIYDTNKWPLFDYELSYYQDNYILHMSIDALIMDGPSFGIFFNELAILYKDINSDLDDLKISFRDYVIKANQVRSSKLYTDVKKYWLNKLPEYNFEARLPTLVNPNSIEKPQFARLTKTISKDKWSQLEEKAKNINVSPTSVVLYVYGLVLSKYSGSNKFCINLTLFNRLPLHDQVNNILGDFTVLELFNYVKTNKNIKEGLLAIHNELWADIENNLFDGIDFQRLIRHKLDMSHNQSLSPVVLTSVLGGGKDLNISMNGYIGTGYSITQTSQVYLDNKAYETDEGFVAEWDYVEQLFDKDVISSMHEAYCNLIEYLAEADWDDD